MDGDCILDNIFGGTIMEQTLIVDVEPENSLIASFSNKEIESYEMKREGLDGATATTIVITLVGAILPSILETLRDYVKVKKKKIYAIEWKGLRIENIDETKLIEVIEMINKEHSKKKKG